MLARSESAFTRVCSSEDIAAQLAGTPWRRLELSERHGIWCLIDAADWDWIVGSRWNYGWHRNTPWKYYAKRNIGAERSTVYLHREIMIRAEPNVVLDANHADHINGQSLDNRRANLRWLTPAQNRAHRLDRDQVPSLEAIVAQLLAGQAHYAEPPF